ncbi:N-acetylglucosamine-6-phosphate deacetylase [Streptomyces sp. bgisy034]|uniref:N-acetylglucosamine-6-phosphate deacetylase n=1 Tax=Streptomyces sp. bgisy034 TaxID=3413774 RepID=UPI003EBF3A9C
MTVDLLLCNARLLTGGRVIDNGYVAVRDGRVVGIGASATADIEAVEVVDCQGRTLTPGFIDIQVNGGGGFMFSTQVDKGNYESVARAHARLGVTTICPTIVSNELDTMLASVRVVAEMCDEGVSGGSRFGGIHIEGPFLDHAKRGGHGPQFLKLPSLDWVKEVIETGRGHVKIFTLAPELPGAMEVIDYLVDQGVFVSAGHTAADAATVRRAVDHGLSGVTHIFNGMDGIQHRVPGVAGVALADDRLFVGLIADLLHLSAETVTTVVRCKNSETLYLTTDAVSPMGSSENSFDLNGVTVTVRDGGCYTEDGVLAGTATPLPVMVKNLRERLGFGEQETLRMVTSTPARIIGRDRDLGVLRHGVLADLVVFEPDSSPWLVVLEGELLR